MNNAFFSIPGYEVISRNDRKDTTDGVGGGLLIYARNDMTGRVSEYTTSELDSFTQTSAIKVRLQGNSEVTLVLLYRPHHIYKDKKPQLDLTTDNNEKLCQLLHLIPKPYVIVGDLNYSNIDWERMSSDAASKKFLTAVQDDFLSQHIEFSTHSSGTQPDVVLSSNCDSVLDVSELGHLGSSDHSLILVTVEGEISRNTTFEEVPDWRKADLSWLRQELASVDWQLENLDTLAAWEAFKCKVHETE